MILAFTLRRGADTYGNRPAPIRPLAENTQRRIARGVKRYVLDNPKPFLITIAHGETGTNGSKRWGSGVRDIDSPATTMTAKGDIAVVAANLSTYYGDKAGTDSRSETLEGPLATQTTENRHALVASFLGQYNGGFAEGNSGDGHSIEDPLSTMSTKGPHQAVIAACLDQANNGFDARVGRPVDEPLSTILTESRGHHGLIAAHMSQSNYGDKPYTSPREPLHTIVAGGTHHGLVASFLSKYNGTGLGQNVDRPADTITSKDRLGLVTVKQIQYVIADIAMRMLQPRELYACQGFRPGYIIDRGADGRMLTKTEQVRMVGNSVCPPMAEALVRANVADLIVRRAA